VGQLALRLQLQAHARFESYVAGDNGLALAQVHAQADGQAGLVWVWGESGLGKSHLLQAACAAANALGRRAMYMPLGHASVQPEWIEGLEQLDLLALDDIECVAGKPFWDRALFGLLDQMLHSDRGLLMAANGPPQSLPFGLPDLASRATAAAVYRLQPLDDAGRLAALLRHAQRRGLELDDKTARYLALRADRDMGALCRWLDVLDERSLAAQRRLTVPFIRETLAAAQQGGGSAAE
jgi:DnaA family protein